MRPDFLFSSFPFIAGKEITLSQIYSSDSHGIETLIRGTEFETYGVSGFLRTINSAFNAKAYIVIGVYMNTNVNKLMGILKFSDFDFKLKSMGLSFYFSRDFSVQNICSVLGLVTSHLFEMVGINRLFSRLNFENPSFETALNFCGFVKESILREGYLDPNYGLLSPVTYSMLKSDYDKCLGSELILKEGDVKITRIVNEDLSSLQDWLSDYNIVDACFKSDEFFDFPKVVAHFSPYITSSSETLSFIIKLENNPIGYIEATPIKKNLISHNLVNVNSAYTVNVFIGNEDDRNKGYGNRAIRILCSYLLKSFKTNIVSILVDKDNMQAINSFIKAGFKNKGTKDSFVLLQKD